MEKDFNKFKAWMKSSTRCYTDEKNGTLTVSEFNIDDIVAIVKRAFLEWSEQDYISKADYKRILQAMLELKEEEQEYIIRWYQIQRAEYEALDEPTVKDTKEIRYKQSYMEDYIRCIGKDEIAVRKEAEKYDIEL